MKHLRNEHELRNNGMACALPVYPPSPNETVKDRRDVRVQLALKRKNGNPQKRKMNLGDYLCII